MSDYAIDAFNEALELLNAPVVPREPRLHGRWLTPNPWLARTKQLVRRVNRHSTGKPRRRDRVFRVRR